jgi:hypothetical protein
MARSAKLTVVSREREVLRLLLEGADLPQIRQFATENEWGVTDRQLYRYQEAAYRGLAEITQRDRVQLLGRHLAQRRALYALAIKADDLRTALEILRDEAKLQGLYPSNDQSININLQQIDWSMFACVPDKHMDSPNSAAIGVSTSGTPGSGPMTEGTK